MVPCYCAFGIPAWRILGHAEYFILRLPARPFLGLVGEAAPPLIIFTPAFWSGWYLPIKFFSFTRYIAQQPVYLIPTASHPCTVCTFSRDICSWGPFNVSISPKFLEEAPKFLANLICAFRGTGPWCSIPTFWFSILLSPGLIYSSTTVSFW